MLARRLFCLIAQSKRIFCLAALKLLMERLLMRSRKQMHGTLSASIHKGLIPMSVLVAVNFLEGKSRESPLLVRLLKNQN
jgi:hypothetical protein